MRLFSYIVPIAVLALIAYAAIKKIKVYDAFAKGVKKALTLVMDIFPYVCTILIMTKLLELSGVTNAIIALLTPVLGFFGIPKEIIPLVILKPFSGGGSLALLNSLIETHGADSYIARCASVVYGSSETIFYVAAVYFSKCKQKKVAAPIIISLVATFMSTVFACLICKIV